MADYGEQVEILERRLKTLQDKVYGGEKLKTSVPCIESLANCHSRLQSAIAGREKIAGAIAKIDELDKYLDPEYAETLGLTEAAKLDIILVEEDNIRNIVDCFQKIEDLKAILDSEHIRKTPHLTGKLAELRQIQIKQEEDYATLSEDIRALLASYNNIITTFTKQFILWDDIVTKMEIAAQPKKIID